MPGRYGFYGWSCTPPLYNANLQTGVISYGLAFKSSEAYGSRNIVDQNFITVGRARAGKKKKSGQKQKNKKSNYHKQRPQRIIDAKQHGYGSG